MSFLLRTNKGRVVYNRRVKPFRQGDVVRITNQVVESLSEQDLTILVKAVTVIGVDASRVRFGAAASLSLLAQLFSVSFDYVLRSLQSDLIDELRRIEGPAADFVDQLSEFIKWSRDPIFKSGTMERKES